MSNYVKSTDFAAKDALASGNSGKIVKGTEIDTEFNNIATAVATKADTASPTFTGTVTLPTGGVTLPNGSVATTQATSDNSTKVATTAYVKAITSTLGTAAQQNVGLSSGNVVQRDDASSVPIGSTWSVKEVSGVLYFAVSGVNKAKLDSSGNLTVAGNVTAYGSV